ncbi:hypothetical protein [Pedobacter namyangjuensis]|uniref:hypothetical protein n=1 Tax=Pedobacter namyangjuensis TaxID=600626 RepID=UPI000DE2D14B|nr:hypothetical protein [Pedobacter namyangjuensis]
MSEKKGNGNGSSPNQKEKVELNIPSKERGAFEKGRVNGGVSEGYQPTRNVNPNPPGSTPSEEKK